MPTPPTPLDRARRAAFLRLIPLLFVCYVIAYIDRTNVAFAMLTMGKDLPQFDTKVFAFGAGVFFIGYFLLEVPGSVLVEKWSARKWICRIMITWGIVAGLTAFVKTPTQFYTMRFLLGLAEAGFFPGVVVYLTHWFTERDRAKALAWFLIATPIAQIIAPLLSKPLLPIGTTTVVDGVTTVVPAVLGLHGWQWVFIVWAIPAVILGIWVLWGLPDWPREARWLKPEERDALQSTLDEERALKGAKQKTSVLAGLTHPRVLLLCAIFVANVTANYGIEFFLPTILSDWYGLKLGQLAWMVAVPSVLVIAGQLYVGWSSDRFQERRWHVLVPLILAALSLAAVPFTRGHLGLTLTCFIIAAAGLKAYLPAFLALPSLFLASTAAASSIGLINSIGNLGGFFGPNILGQLKESTGSYEIGLWCLGGSVAVACFLLSLIPKAAFRAPQRD